MVGMKFAIILTVFISAIKANKFQCAVENGTAATSTFIKCRSVGGDNLDLDHALTEFLATPHRAHGAELMVKGDISDMKFNGTYSWLGLLVLFAPKGLGTFLYSNYERNPRLDQVRIAWSREKININLTTSSKGRKLPKLSLRENKEIEFDCNSLKNSELLNLTVSSSPLDGFDFNCLPSTIEVLRLYHSIRSNPMGLNSLTNLGKLEILHLERNGLGSFDLRDLPNSVKELNLYNNNIKILYHTDSLKQLTHLEILNVGSNSLTFFDCEHLPTSVKELNLYNNHIRNLLHTDSLKQLTHLEILNLESNGLTSFDVELPDKVTELNLCYNSLTTFDVTNLPPSITKLSLCNNSLTSFDFQGLPSSIKELNLYNNNIKNLLHTDSLKQLTHLEILNLGSNSLTSFDCEHLSNSVKELNLGNNRLDSFDLAAVPTSLKILSLVGNGLNLDTFPLKEHKTFTRLDLSGNQDESGHDLHSYSDRNLTEFLTNLKAADHSHSNADSTTSQSTFPTTTYIQPTMITLQPVNGTDSAAGADGGNNKAGAGADGGNNKAGAGADGGNNKAGAGSDGVQTKTADDGDDSDDSKTGDDGGGNTKAGAGSDGGNTKADAGADDDGDDNEDGCVGNHVAMPLIVVVCLRLLVNFF